MRKFEIRNPLNSEGITRSEATGSQSETNSKFKIQNSKHDLKHFYHFDCYRINEPKEILSLGFEKIISDSKNIVAVEWADRIKNLLPKETILVHFELVNENTRKIVMRH